MVRIEHIAMYAKNLEKVRAFFMQYFGATSDEGYHNPKTDFRSYFLSFDQGARLEIMNKHRLAVATAMSPSVWEARPPLMPSQND